MEHNQLVAEKSGEKQPIVARNGSMSETGIKKGFLLSFIIVIGIGAINFGYSIGVFNSLMVDFLRVFEIKPAD